MNNRKRIPNIPGIYKIESISMPNLFYIGSSVRLRDRAYKHLLRNCEKNPYLSRHIKKYGVSDLKITVLKLCPEYHLQFWEQYYISELNPPYNIFRFSSFYDKKANEAKAFAFREISGSLFDKEKQLLIITNEILT